MSVGQVPVQVDPFRLVRQGRRICGLVPSDRFERVRAAARFCSPEFELELAGNTDESGQPLLTGWVRGDLELRCERCGEGMRFEFDVPLLLALVGDDATAAAVASRYDPVLVTEDQMALVDLIEDEVLLALPLVARHAEGQCHGAEAYSAGPGSSPQTQRPFANLADLLGEQSRRSKNTGGDPSN